MSDLVKDFGDAVWWQATCSYDDQMYQAWKIEREQAERALRERIAALEAENAALRQQLDDERASHDYALHHAAEEIARKDGYLADCATERAMYAGLYVTAASGTWQPLTEAEGPIHFKELFPTVLWKGKGDDLFIGQPNEHGFMDDDAQCIIVRTGPSYAFCRRQLVFPTSELELPTVILIPPPDWSEYAWAQWAELTFFTISGLGLMWRYLYCEEEPSKTQVGIPGRRGRWAYSKAEGAVLDQVPRDRRLHQRPRSDKENDHESK